MIFFLSKDPVLQLLENKVQKLCINHIDTLMQLMQDGHIEASIALQWIHKNSILLTKIIDLLEKEIYVKHFNILLRQLIPCIANMSSKMKMRLTKSLASLLRHGAPNVRNKALSILSDMDKSILLSLPQDCIAFIQDVSTTRQLNCAYPAKEILEKLKTPEA